MSDEVKVYKPETIKDTPFPQEEGEGLETSQKTGVVYTPQTIRDQPFPIARISNELISSVLNTKTKKILGEFTFTPSGALKIGDYQEGEAGQINISPDGIVARNTDGETTFSLDGDTGDATFLGTVRAGSLISDSTIEGGAININDVFLVDADGNVTMLAGSLNINDKFIVDTNGNVTINTGQITLKDEDEETVIDAKGLVSATSFPQSNVITTGLNQKITTAESDWTDITNASFTFSLDRTALVLVMAKVTYWVTRDSGAGDFGGDALIRFNVDTVGQAGRIWSRGIYDSGTTDSRGTIGGNIGTTSYMQFLSTLGAGSHTIKMEGTCNVASGDPALNIYNYYLSYIIFGK